MTRDVDGHPRALESSDSATGQQAPTAAHTLDVHDVGTLRLQAYKYYRAMETRRRAARPLLDHPDGVPRDVVSAYDDAAKDVEREHAQCAFALMHVFFGGQWLDELTARLAGEVAP